MGTTMVSGSKMAVLDALVTAVLGYATVFAGIILLIIVVIVIGKIMIAAQERARQPQPVVNLQEKPQPAVSEVKTAPGSAGELKLYDTDPRTAAMIMAIVADSLGKPLNELRFKSIREVKEDEI